MEGVKGLPRARRVGILAAQVMIGPFTGPIIPWLWGGRPCKGADHPSDNHDRPWYRADHGQRAWVRVFEVPKRPRISTEMPGKGFQLKIDIMEMPKMPKTREKQQKNQPRRKRRNTKKKGDEKHTTRLERNNSYLQTHKNTQA